MALKVQSKTTFDPTRVIRPIYTGGSVALNELGDVLATTVGEEALIVGLHSGTELARIEGDGEPLTTISLSPDTAWLVTCSRSLSMRIFALERNQNGGYDAKLWRTVKAHPTPVVIAAIDSTSSLLATGGAEGAVKVWDIRGGYTSHTFHGHSGVVSALHFFQADESAEEKTTSKSKKRKSQTQAGNDYDSANEATATFRLASGGEDGKIRIWNLYQRKSEATLNSHASVVRCLDYHPKLKVLLSGSRDRTVVLWSSSTWQAVSTIATNESVESAGFVVSGQCFFTGGDSARVRIWHSETGEEVTEQQSPGTEVEAIIDVLYSEGLPVLVAVHADQTFTLHSLKPLEETSVLPLPPLPVIQRISGTHDEVIDLAYVGSRRNMLALATNLEDIRLISIDRENDIRSSLGPYFGADVALLKGHSDIIISIDTDWSGHWLATGAKDNVAKLWRLDPENHSYICYATFTGHAESISAVALPNAVPTVGSKEYRAPLHHPPKFMVSGSQDKTVKRWDVPAAAGKVPKASYTRKAHDKDINAVETSYAGTSTLFATASQDRTVKIWDVETGEAIGVLRGHKRGVWSLAFSPTDMPSLTTNESGGASSAKGMIVTGSGDKTVRIWSLSDYSCLRTFEGHANSVLKVVWFPAPEKGKAAKKSRNVQVASAAGDGLVKVWDAQEGDCAATLDNHIDRVWALAVKPSPILSKDAISSLDKPLVEQEEVDEDETESGATIEIVSGSADSTLTFWTDTTATTALQATSQATARVEQDQELQNYIRASNYRDAIVLALQMNHPKRLLGLFTAVVNGRHDSGSLTGRTEVDTVLSNLSDGQLWNLLQKLRDWNANARTHNVAQHILYALLRLHPRERILHLRKRRKAIVDSDDALADAATELSGREKMRQKEGVKDVLDGLKAYTERHYTRLEKTGDERFVLLWALQQMHGVGGDILMDDGLAKTLGAPQANDVMMLNGTL